MVRTPFHRRRAERAAAAPPRRTAVTLAAESVPAAWLRGVRVVGPAGEPLGTVSLLVRRSDGARVAVVQPYAPRQTRRVVDLTGGHLDEAHQLHVRSSADVDILGARVRTGR